MKISAKSPYFIIFIILLLGSFVIYHLPVFDHDEYVATVTRLETKRKENSDQYMVFTKLQNGDVRVFVIEDSLIHLRWNSSDMFGKFEEGATYRLDTYGYRIPFLSYYENILEAELLHKPKEEGSLEDLTREELLERIRQLEEENSNEN